MSNSVFDEYLTVLGPVQAARVKFDNIHEVCRETNGSVVDVTPLDAPDPVLQIKLTAFNNHDEVYEDTADIGEWVVIGESGHISVYSDKRFLKLLEIPTLNRQASIDLVKQAMAYQEVITIRGGELTEGYSTAEFVVMQIENLFK